MNCGFRTFIQGEPTLLLLDGKKQDSPSQETYDGEIYPPAPEGEKEHEEAKEK